MNLPLPLEESVSYLREITSLNPRRGTDFLEITVKHESRRTAVAIANTIATMAVENSRQIYQDRAQRALKVLAEELAAQEEIFYFYMPGIFLFSNQPSTQAFKIGRSTFALPSARFLP